MIPTQFHTAECAACCSADVRYTCLHCGACHCRQHAPAHAAAHDHVYAAEMVPGDVADSAELLQTVSLPDFNYCEVPEDLQPIVSSLEGHKDVNVAADEVAARGSRRVCTHAHPCPNPLSVAPVRACYACHQPQNLWVCLTCGHVGCGRAQVGLPGRGCAAAHAAATGHPVAVRLSSLDGRAPASAADVYCYSCNSDVIVEDLPYLLSCVGVDFAGARPTEPSLAAADAAANSSALGMAAITNSQPIKDFCGLRNTGNTCYAASLLQALARAPALAAAASADERERRHAIAESNNDEYESIGLQYTRIMSALGHPAPHHLPSLRLLLGALASAPAGAALVSGDQRGRQQDVCELFSALAGAVPDLFSSCSFSTEESLECMSSACKAKSVRAGQAISLVAEVVAAAENQLAANVPSPRVSLHDALSASDVQIPGYNCHACGKKTFANLKLSPTSQPETLIILLPRVGIDFSTGMPRKHNISVEVPKLLVLGGPQLDAQQANTVNELLEMTFPIGLARAAVAAAGADVDACLDWIESAQEMGQDEELKVEGEVYRPVGAVLHFGNSPNVGHYVALVFENDQWVLVNDTDAGVVSNGPEWLEQASLLVMTRL